MGIRRKPESVDKFILGGSRKLQSAAATTADPSPDTTVYSVRMRLPSDLLRRIDINLGRRQPKPSRHQWILEAIYQKLEHDQEN
jgi:hypothetical protein